MVVPSWLSITCGELMCRYFGETMALDFIRVIHVGSAKTSDPQGCGKCLEM